MSEIATKQKTYGEIINPSDYYTICVDDREAAAAAVLILGGGYYSIKSDGFDMPILMFAGVDEWWDKKFNHSFERFLDTESPRIADALDSVFIGNRYEFLGKLTEVPEEDREAFRLKWEDEHRSSMNDIGARAKAYATKLRKPITETAVTP